MKVLNTFNLFVVIAIFLNIINAEETVETAETEEIGEKKDFYYEFKPNSYLTFNYTKDGVFRYNNECNLNFINFGTSPNLSDGGKIFLTNKNDRSIVPFNVTIHKLFNGNIGLNNDTEFDPIDVKNYIVITQKNGDEVKNITDFSVALTDNGTKFSLTINNLYTCEGITIKQTFKDETVVVANRLYYVNVVPEGINKAFNAAKFGPSYSYPFHRIHWKINEGLDDLRETCGIYMYYDGFVNTNKNISAHWRYYLSPEKDEKTINANKCTPEEFFTVLKRHYIDYHYTEELLGKSYMGYVLKREGHDELHMDGVIAKNGFLIEMYQNSCNPEFEQQTSCTIRSEKKITFNEFVSRYARECLGINLEEEEPEWTIEGDKAVGTLKHQIITIERPKNNDDKRGSLPTDPESEINYYDFNKDYDIVTTPVARFSVSFQCKDGSYLNNSCKCELCPITCLTCTSKDNCTKCREGTKLIDGECQLEKGYYIDEKSEIKECDIKCAECSRSGACTVCKDIENTILSDGVCICKFSYFKTDGTCAACDEGCLICDRNECLACKEKTKTPVEGKCEIKKSE